MIPSLNYAFAILTLIFLMVIRLDDHLEKLRVIGAALMGCGIIVGVNFALFFRENLDLRDISYRYGINIH